MEVPKDIVNDALDYPYNLKYTHFLKFFFAPTLCYQLQYPTSSNFRFGFFLKRVFEFVVCQYLIVYIVLQHLIPVCDESVEAFKQRDTYKMLHYVLKASTPAAYCWLLGFYSFFHSAMNISGEITYFSDRRFYLDWWNAGNLGEYWRKWNLPVHHFLIRHIYYPARRAKIGKAQSMLIVFFVSAVVHEYLVSF